jgi:copper chaperone NosL
MKTFISILTLLVLFSCGSKEAQPIKLNVDDCAFCKMKVADSKFGAELITDKGRVYIFDDISCMIKYHHENSETKIKSYFVHDYNQDNVLIPVETAFFISGGNINSPMRGNIITVSTKEDVGKFAKEFNANPITWEEIL